MSSSNDCANACGGGCGGEDCGKDFGTIFDPANIKKGKAPAPVAEGKKKRWWCGGVGIKKSLGTSCPNLFV